MKGEKIYILLIALLILLFYEAFTYNSLVLKENEKMLLNEKDEMTKKKETKNISLKDFKGIIEHKNIKIESINKNNDSYKAIVNFEGTYEDLKEYLNRLSEKEISIQDYKINGNLEKVLCTLNLT